MDNVVAYIMGWASVWYKAESLVSAKKKKKKAESLVIIGQCLCIVGLARSHKATKEIQLTLLQSHTHTYKRERDNMYCQIIQLY